MTEAIIWLGRRLLMPRFSTVTGWEPTARSTRCWRALAGCSFPSAFTDPFYDIDVESDLTRLAAELRLAPARAPRTAAWLKQWQQVIALLRTAAGDL